MKRFLIVLATYAIAGAAACVFVELTVFRPERKRREERDRLIREAKFVLKVGEELEANHQDPDGVHLHIVH